MQKEIAKTLLRIKAVKLSPDTPFTWASGWKSPIYCDNRTILSYPKERKMIGKSFAHVIHQKYPQVDLIAGVATGAIAWGVLAAVELDKPAIYVRSEAKGHGLTNQVEGHFKKGQKVVVVEDLISTGGSSLAAVKALQNAGLEVVGMVAIFTYGFPKAESNFKKEGVSLNVLSNYDALIEEAMTEKYISKEQLSTLKEWREAPDKWRQ